MSTSLDASTKDSCYIRGQNYYPEILRECVCVEVIKPKNDCLQGFRGIDSLQGWSLSFLKFLTQ